MIRFDSNRKEFEKQMLKELKQMKKLKFRLTEWAKVLAIECMNDAIQKGAYTDRTKVLRSSYGVDIYLDGKKIDRQIVTGIGEGAGDAEQSLANALNESRAEIPKDGIFFIMVAGAHYASFVEAKGYNVLHLTGVFLKSEWEKKFKEEFSKL